LRPLTRNERRILYCQHQVSGGYEGMHFCGFLDYCNVRLLKCKI